MELDELKINVAHLPPSLASAATELNAECDRLEDVFEPDEVVGEVNYHTLDADSIGAIRFKLANARMDFIRGKLDILDRRAALQDDWVTAAEQRVEKMKENFETVRREVHIESFDADRITIGRLHQRRDEAEGRYNSARHVASVVTAKGADAIDALRQQLQTELEDVCRSLAGLPPLDRTPGPVKVVWNALETERRLAEMKQENSSNAEAVVA